MRIEFLLSAAGTKDFIADGKPKIILAGRSNAGKSSVINRAAGTRIARVSASPGKTAFVNYYLVENNRYWIDLPGYGYAKVSEGERKRWGALMEDFFKQADGSAYRGALIVDIRREPNALDVQMADLFRARGIGFAILANKSDKLKPREIPPALEVIKNALGVEPVPCSALKGTGDIKCVLS